MKNVFLPLALVAALGLAACTKSGDAANNTAAVDSVVLNDEGAITDGNRLDVLPANGDAGAALDANAVDPAANSSPGNGL